MDDDSISRDEQQVGQRPDSQTSQAAHQRTGSGDTERPPSEQQSHDSNEKQTDEDTKEDNHAEEQDGEDSDPAEMIVDFDWSDLTQRYHDAMNKCTEEEALLMQEWAGLMEYFRVWAESGHIHESDRSFRRLVTRSAFVQNEEDKLEKTRAHYVNVVKAFESALSLLQTHGFGA